MNSKLPTTGAEIHHHGILLTKLRLTISSKKSFGLSSLIFFFHTKECRMSFGIMCFLQVSQNITSKYIGSLNFRFALTSLRCAYAFEVQKYGETRKFFLINFWFVNILTNYCLKFMQYVCIYS